MGGSSPLSSEKCTAPSGIEDVVPLNSEMCIASFGGGHFSSLALAL